MNIIKRTFAHCITAYLSTTKILIIKMSRVSPQKMKEILTHKKLAGVELDFCTKTNDRHWKNI